MMDWTTIITAVLSAVAGGGGGWWLTAKQQRKRADADTASVEVESQVKVIASLSEQNEKLAKANEELLHKISEVTEKLLNKKAENLTAATAACFHFGCTLRKPILGCGKDWMEKHKGDPFLLVDYLTFEELIRNAKKAKAPKQEEQQESPEEKGDE